MPSLQGLNFLQLAKPVRPAELVATVASLAGRTRQPAEAQEARA